MTATATTIFVGEKLSLLGWAGIVALVAGVFLLSARGGRDLAKIDRRAVGFALFTALTICAYSVVDGIGGRLAGNPNAYSLWLFVGIARGDAALCALPRRPRRHPGDADLLAARLCRRRLAGSVLRHRDLGDDGGADRHRRHLRETSVLFGAVIAVVVLKEPLRAVRIVAALLIVCGLVLIRLQ